MKSLSVSLRRRGDLILVVVIAALAILWYGRQNKPEHLQPGSPFISESALPESHYALNENPRTHTLNLAYSRASGDKFQKIVSVPLPPGLHYDPMLARLLRVNGDLVYFTLVEETEFQRSSFGFGRAAGGGSLIPHGDRVKSIIRHFFNQPPKEKMYVCCLSTQGGAIQTLLSGKGITNVAITDDTIYWIDPRPEPVTSIESMDGFSRTITPTSLLMATSLKTLQTRRIADKMSLSVHLVSDQSSLYWFRYDSGRGRQPSTHVWLYAPDLPGPVHLTDNYKRGDGVLAGNNDKPIALGDRLYWLEDHIETLPPPQGVATSTIAAIWRVVETSVVSVRRDGTRRRVVMTLPVIASTPSFTIFATDQNRLYLGLTESARRLSDVQVITYICRVDPEAPQPLTRLLRLPNTVRVERIYKGYVYYVVTEEHNDFFGDARRESIEHYRWMLPDECHS